jgi:hypothetical protein
MKAPTKYEQMGIAALLPGMTYAIEVMQKQVDEMRAQLTGSINGDDPVKRKVGRPAGAAGNRAGWSDDPEERKVEAQRRADMRRQNKLTEERRERGRIAAKKRWDGLTAKQKAAHVQRMNEGRLNKHVNGAAA